MPEAVYDDKKAFQPANSNSFPLEATIKKVGRHGVQIDFNAHLCEKWNFRKKQRKNDATNTRFKNACQLIVKLVQCLLNAELHKYPQ